MFTVFVYAAYCRTGQTDKHSEDLPRQGWGEYWQGWGEYCRGGESTAVVGRVLQGWGEYSQGWGEYCRGGESTAGLKIK